MNDRKMKDSKIACHSELVSESSSQKMLKQVQHDRKMKDSGIDWIGEIPEEWETIRLKHIFQIKKDIAGKEGFTVLSVTQNGIKPKDMSSKGQFAMDYSKYQLVNPGEFIMNHMDLKTGWIDISKYDGVTSPDYRVFFLKNEEKCVSQYYKQIFQYCYKNLIFFSLGQGVADLGRWRLPAEMFNNFMLPLPPKSEQEKISQFLDQKCSEIDSIIEESKKSIEEYKAWKQSVIFEAVTGKVKDEKGKMKDSGIEWIGEIPEGWEICQIKRFVKLYNGQEVKQEILKSDNSIDVYGSGGVFKYTDKYLCEGESVLFGRKGSIGKPIIVTGKFWTVDTMYYSICRQTFASNRFFYYLLMIFPWNLFTTKTALPSIVGSEIFNQFVSLPPLSEQEFIVKMLDEKCSQIDSLIEEKQSLIEDLTEYKKSLVFEVVTGKRRL